MSYTREQRAANAAKKAAQAATAATPAASTPPAFDLPASPKKPGPPPPAIPPRGNPRAAAYAEIESLYAQRTGQEAPGSEEPQGAPETTPEAPAAPAPAAEPAAAEAAPEPAASAEPAASPEAEPAAEPVKTTRQVVDGKEYDVPQSEIDEAGGPAAWRKSKAADNRLAEAKEALAQSKRSQAAIVQYVQSLAKQQPAQPTPQQVEFNKFLQNGIEYIRQGTPEQAAQAMQEILARAIPQVNPDALQYGAVVQMKRQMAVDAFKEEFPEIKANPTLMNFASSIENQRLAQLGQQGGMTNPEMAAAFDWKAFYRMIGNEVRSLVPRPSQPQPAAVKTPSPPSAVPDKEARKASIVNLPTAAAKAELPPEEKPETRDEILNNMRKKRGLPTV